jgi:hypothetical protein
MMDRLLSREQYDNATQRALDLIHAPGNLTAEQQAALDQLIVMLDEYENRYQPAEKPAYIWQQNRR